MGAGLLARVVHVVVSVVVLIIVVGIVLVLLKANATNSLVSQVHDWARWLVVRSTASSASTMRASRSPSTGASPRSST
jgi:hypothetical protein